METVLTTDNLILEHNEIENYYTLTLFTTSGSYDKEIKLNPYQLSDLQYNLPSVEIDVE